MTLAACNDNMDFMTDPSGVTILQCTQDHIRELKDNLRHNDRTEIENFGWSAGRGLWRSYKQGINNMTAIIGGEVAACWGVVGTYIGDQGKPWLLTSSAIHKISPLKFARLYQLEVHKMLNSFDRLENYVCNEYPGAIRLLSIVGFTIEEPQKLGDGMYRKFYIERAN